MREALAKFLSERKEIIIQSYPDKAPRRQFTFDNPHLCSRCNEIMGEPIWIKEGMYLPLGRSTLDAVTAALDGCDFYQWIVDFGKDYFTKNGAWEYLEEPLWIWLPNINPELPRTAEADYALLAIGRLGRTGPVPYSPRGIWGHIFVCSRYGK